MMEIILNNISGWSYAISWSILDSLWQFLIIGLGLRVILQFVPNHQVTLRYHLSLVALGFCAIWWLSNVSSNYTIFQSSVSETITIDNKASNRTIETKIIHPVISPNSETISSNNSNRTKVLSSYSSFIKTAKDWININKEWLLLFWIIGVVTLSIQFISSWLHLKKLRNTSLKIIHPKWETRLKELQDKLMISKSIKLAISPLVHEPITFGHFKPLILLPIGLINSLSTEEVEAILLHELAHIKRYDFLINVFQSCLEIIFFYHPVIKWMNKMIRASREECCDDLVISIQNDRQVYASSLLHIHKYSLNIKNSLIMTASGKKGLLSQRIQRLFEPVSKTKKWSFSGTLVIVFLLFGSMALFAFQTIRNQPTVSISADKMNILYYGLENPLTVAVEGISNSDITVSSEDVILTDLGNGKYTGLPQKLGDVKITVETSSMKKDMIFVSEIIPTPNIANVYKGQTSNFKMMTVEEIKSVKGIEMELIEKFGVSCEVVYYEITRVPIDQDPVTETTKQGEFTGRVRTLVDIAKSEDTYYFDNIRVKCLGDEEPREINSLVFKVY